MTEQRMVPVTEELKPLPCPFCGGPAMVDVEKGNWNVGCFRDVCGLGPFVFGNTREAAITVWNTRAAPPLSPASGEERDHGLWKGKRVSELSRKELLRAKSDMENSIKHGTAPLTVEVDLFLTAVVRRLAEDKA